MFCIRYWWILICGLFAVALASQGLLITFSTEVPMYIRAEEAYQSRDALIADENDATYDPLESVSGSSSKQQEGKPSIAIS